jgi:hypothetical protein
VPASAAQQAACDHGTAWLRADRGADTAAGVLAQPPQLGVKRLLEGAPIGEALAGRRRRPAVQGVD